MTEALASLPPPQSAPPPPGYCASIRDFDSYSEPLVSTQQSGLGISHLIVLQPQDWDRSASFIIPSEFLLSFS